MQAFSTNLGQYSMNSIAEQIKATVREIFMLQAQSNTDWIWKIREIKQSPEYKQAKDAYKKFALITSQGYSKKHDSLATFYTYNQLLEKFRKDAELKLSKIDFAVAKKLSGVEVEHVKCLHCGLGKDGFAEGTWHLTDKEGQLWLFSFDTIYAGGYNIQCMHVRTQYTIKKLKQQ